MRSKSWDHLQWDLKNAKAPDIPWKLNAEAPNLPSFGRVNINGDADMISFVLSKKSPDAAWQDIINKYNAQGYQQLEKEMNDFAHSIGM